MYKVYADSLLLYSDTIENLKIFDTNLLLEVNKAGSFKFTIYPDHPYYNTISKLKTIITVYQDDFLLFKGRVLNDDLGFRNQKNITCESDLAFLIDSICRPYDYSGSIEGFLSMLIENHNSQVESSHRFTLGTVTVTDTNNTIARSSIDYANTWTVINDKLIKLLGGYISIRHEDGVNYIDYLQDFTLLSSQTIEFAKNLLDLKRLRRGEEIATALIPLGAKLKNEEGQTTDKRLDITEVNGGIDYIYDEEAVGKYGWIFATKIWEDVTLANNLLTKAKLHLGTLISASETIELSAADLAPIDKTVTSFHLGTYVTVKSKPHGIEQNFLVSKLSINLLKPAANKLTLGGVVKTFTDNSLENEAIKGADGKDGATLYTWIKYSQYADGTDMTDSAENALYIGIAYNKTSATESTDKADYSWSKIKGDSGEGSMVQSDTEPTETNVMWLDTSAEPPLLKRYNSDTEEWEALNDTSDITDSIVNLTKDFSAAITQNSETLLSEISEKYYVKSDTDRLISETKTEFQQTSEAFEMRFDQFSTDLEDVISGTDAQFQEINKYIRFENGNIILGQAGNELILKIQNDKISFLEADAEVAYFNNRKLYITDGEFLNALQLGNFAFMPRTNGNLSFKKTTI